MGIRRHYYGQRQETALEKHALRTDTSRHIQGAGSAGSKVEKTQVRREEQDVMGLKREGAIPTPLPAARDMSPCQVVGFFFGLAKRPGNETGPNSYFPTSPRGRP